MLFWGEGEQRKMLTAVIIKTRIKTKKTDKKKLNAIEAEGASNLRSCSCCCLWIKGESVLRVV
jgi:hypothetical protein